jgi:hypothetical protein
VSGLQRHVHAFERFCGSNHSAKYAKLNTGNQAPLTYFSIRVYSARLQATLHIAQPRFEGERLLRDLIEIVRERISALEERLVHRAGV